MYIQQIYTGCLAQAAYYIESEGEAAIIDPLRDIQAYLILPQQEMLKSNIFLKPISMLILFRDI